MPSSILLSSCFNFFSQMIHLLTSEAICLLLIISLQLIWGDGRSDNPVLLTACANSERYASGSKFENNLDTLLVSLVSNGSSTGFSKISIGESPDLVNGLVQCKDEISVSECRNCLNRTRVEIARRCPFKKEVDIRFEYCLLRFSDKQLSFQQNGTPWIGYSDDGNVSNTIDFNGKLIDFMNTLSSQAELDPNKFEEAVTILNENSSISGWVQCTRDQSGANCLWCLQGAIGELESCCNGSRGWVASPSCILSYKVKPLIQSSERSPAPITDSPIPLAPSPAPSPPPQLDRDSDSAPNTTNTSRKEGNKNTSRNMMIISIPVSITMLLVFAICIYLWSSKALKKSVDVGDEEGIGSVESLLFDLDTLVAATDNFAVANKLGEGGFGPVYKGKLSSGQEIAVKRLWRRSEQGMQQLKTEVLLVAKLQHRNLVRLLGCCLEEPEKLLVYEYMPNSSLDYFLFDPIRCLRLDWALRYKIIQGIARGLLYLHEDSRLKIIHRDMKASNILLDENMNPKISDFGLAKLFGGDETHASTNQIAGTRGYMAPEYVVHGHFSTKSDVFSFGVIVLEIITSRRNTGFHETEQATNLLSYAWQHWSRGTTLQLIGQTLGEYVGSEVLRCVQIGLLCVQEDATNRPTMSSVVLMLNSSLVTLPSPSPPAFCSNGNRIEMSARDFDLPGGEFEQSRGRLTVLNHEPITELDCR